jgi:hypothetical protein
MSLIMSCLQEAVDATFEIQALEKQIVSVGVLPTRLHWLKLFCLM